MTNHNTTLININQLLINERPLDYVSQKMEGLIEKIARMSDEELTAFCDRAEEELAKFG